MEILLIPIYLYISVLCVDYINNKYPSMKEEWKDLNLYYTFWAYLSTGIFFIPFLIYCEYIINKN